MKRSIRLLSSFLATALIASAIPFTPLAKSNVQAATVVLTRSNFSSDTAYNAVIGRFDQNGDRQLDTDECNAVTAVSFPGYGGFGDCSWVKYFPNATSVVLSNDDVSKIDVSTLTKLTKITLSGQNSFTSIDLSNNSSLTEIYISDVASLTSIKLPTSSSVTTIELRKDSLTSIDLSKQTKVTKVNVAFNKLTSINISGCSALKELQCQDNNLTSLDITKSTSLSSLYCYGNNISSINVYGNTKLTTISNLDYKKQPAAVDETAWGASSGQTRAYIPWGCILYSSANGDPTTPIPTVVTPEPTRTSINTCNVVIWDQAYTGGLVTPSVTVTDGSTTLILNTDYTLTFKNNVNPGTATAIITGDGKYKDTREVNFKILGNLSIAAVSDISPVTYNGSAQQPKVTVAFGSETLVEGRDYYLTYSNNTNAGTAKVFVNGTGNYSGSYEKQFVINKASINGATVTGLSTQQYTGSQIKPVPTVTVNGRTLTYNTDFTCTWENNVEPGTGAKVTITAAGTNYTGSTSATFKIERNVVTLTASNVDNIAAQTYTGNAITPAVTVKYNNTTLKPGTDYEVTYSNNVNAGTGKVTITAKGGYTGTFEKTFTINKANLSSASNSSVSSQTYNGSAFTPAVTLTFNNKQLTEGTDYTVSYNNNTNAGTATITFTAKSNNFTGTKTVNFTINRASISGAAISGVSTQKYTGGALTPVPTVVVNSVTLKNGTDFDLKYENNVNVGTAKITITGKGNYTGSTTATFEIKQDVKNIASATVDNIANQTYSGNAINPGVVVKYNGSTLTKDKDYTVVCTNNVNAGTAKVTITGKGDYTGTIEKTFTINKANMSSASVAAIANAKYRGAEIKPEPAVTFGGKTLVNGTDYTLSYSNNIDAGTATVTITGKGNFTGSVNKTFTIVALEGLEGFCSRLYLCALSRPYDDDGLATWVRVLSDGSYNGAQAAAGFFFSDEFKAANLPNDEYVKRLYRTFMNREPDQGGYNTWMNALNSGWTREQVFYGFVNSAEWASICQSYGIKSGAQTEPSPTEKVQAFVTRLYTTCLCRAADPDGVANWTRILVNHEMGGTMVAAGFFFSAEFGSYNVQNDDYVDRLYRTFMDREADPDGRNMWIGLLNSGAWTRQMVFMGFADSNEFAGICASYGIDR